MRPPKKAYYIKSVWCQSPGVFTARITSGIFEITLWVYSLDGKLVAMQKPPEIFISDPHWYALRDEVRDILELRASETYRRRAAESRETRNRGASSSTHRGEDGAHSVEDGADQP